MIVKHEIIKVMNQVQNYVTYVENCHEKPKFSCSV